MIQRLSILLTGFCWLLTGCQQTPEPATTSQAVLKVLGGETVVDIIRSADTARAYRLPPETFYNDRLSEYDVPAGSLAVPAASLASLKRVLLDEESYELLSAKGCEPIFGVGVTFEKGDDTVDVLFCFQCDILVVYHHDEDVGGEDFDPVRPTLISVMKQTFVDDDVIQGLQ